MQNLSRGTHGPLLLLSSTLCFVQWHRGARADQAVKVPVLQVQLHSIMDLMVMLCMLKGTSTLGFRRANLSML